MILKVPSNLYDAMHSEVSLRAPEEACGLLAGADGLAQECISITNRLHSPVRFQMDPLEQVRALQKIEAAGLDLLAIYHSHPQGPPNPSETDLAEFAYPGVTTLIWSPRSKELADWQVHAFDLTSGRIERVHFVII